MPEIKVRVNRDKCCYCGACVSVCPIPEGALDLRETILIVDHEICTGCGICVKICPVGALSLAKPAKTQLTAKQKQTAQ